jgi:hypothetical protein
MNNRRIPTLAVLLMVSTLAACASTPAPAPTTAATIPATATNSPQPTSTLQPTPTPVTYPMRLEYIGGVGGIADALALKGYRIYLKVGPRVVTIDVSDPYHPKEKGHSDVSIEDIDLIDTSGDSHVLVQDKEATLWEFEALPDGNLTLLHTYARNDPDRPEMKTTYELVATGGGYSFEYDPDSLDTPSAQPLTVRREVIADEVMTAIDALPAGMIAASKIIAARGRYVYIAVSYGLSIYDIGVKPDRPYIWGPMDGNRKTMWREVATLEMMSSDFFYGMVPIHPSVQIFDSYLLTSSGVWSLANPENPMRPSDNENPVFPCNGLSVEGGIIYPYIDRSGLYTFLDMRNPNHYSNYHIATDINDAYDAFGSGKGLLFVSRGYESGNKEYSLNILDVSDPFNPKPLSSYPVQGNPYYDSYTLIGEYLYIHPATSTTPIILDLTNPTRPEPVDTSANPFPAWNQPIVYNNWIFDLRFNHLFTYSSDNIFTPVADFAIPESEGFIDQSSNPLCFNDKLYVYGSGDMVYVIGINDPVHPQVLVEADIPSGWHIANIASYGDYLYFVGVYREIRIYKLVPN